MVAAKGGYEGARKSQHDNADNDSKILDFILGHGDNFKQHAHSFIEFLDIVQEFDDHEANEHSIEIGIVLQMLPDSVHIDVLVGVDYVLSKILLGMSIVGTDVPLQHQSESEARLIRILGSISGEVRPMQIHDVNPHRDNDSCQAKNDDVEEVPDVLEMLL